MARSGGRSEWERQQAALRREIERQQREEARRAKEREKAQQQQHIEAQQHAAEVKTAAVEQQVKVLDEILTGILWLPPLTFDALKVAPVPPRIFGTDRRNAALLDDPRCGALALVQARRSHQPERRPLRQQRR